MKPEPIDTALIAQATRFDATLFLGVGHYHTETFDTLAAAREAAATMPTRLNSKRRGMIYAITAEGRSAFVPNSFQLGDFDMTTINMSAAQIAQLSAIVTGGGMKRSADKDTAAKRFVTLAQDAKLAFDPMTVLAMDFETAKATVGGAKAPAKIEAVHSGAADHFELNAAGKKAVRAAAKASPKPAKAAKAPTAAPKAAAGKRAETLAAAERGELPAPPDFSAATHARFRGKLAEIVALVEAGDVKALKAFAINPISSSPKALDKFRNLAVTALEAKGKGRA